MSELNCSRFINSHIWNQSLKWLTVTMGLKPSWLSESIQTQTIFSSNWHQEHPTYLGERLKRLMVCSYGSCGCSHTPDLRCTVTLLWSPENYLRFRETSCICICIFCDKHKCSFVCVLFCCHSVRWQSLFQAPEATKLQTCGAETKTLLNLARGLYTLHWTEWLKFWQCDESFLGGCEAQTNESTIHHTYIHQTPFTDTFFTI